MNPKKFGSPHFDTPSSRYNFYNFATKSVKTNKENQIHSGSATRYTRSIHPAVTDVRASKVNRPHMSVRPRQGRALSGENSPMAKSSAMRSPPLCSRFPRASTGALSWPRGSLELARWWRWQLNGGTWWRSSRFRP